MNDRYGFLTDPHRKSFNALTRNALQQLLSKSHPPAYRRHVITTWTLNLSGREDLTVQGALVKKKKSMGIDCSQVWTCSVSTVPEANFWNNVSLFLNTNEIAKTRFNNNVPLAACLTQEQPPLDNSVVLA